MEHVIERYERKFGAPAPPSRAVRSPLRICPLGAHVDHQDGVVSGMALTDSIDLVYTPEDDGYLRVQSLDFPDEEYFHVDQVPDMVPTFWGNYLRGAVLSLSRSFKLHRGIRGVVRGNLPIGGLSSSAAVTTAYLMALCDVNEIEIPPRELAHRLQPLGGDRLHRAEQRHPRPVGEHPQPRRLPHGNGLPDRGVRHGAALSVHAGVRDGHRLLGHQHDPHKDRLQQSCRRMQGCRMAAAGARGPAGLRLSRREAS
ncbi:MAG: hypothetical protein GVY14_10585 [Spirochaetes bacterium]|nr:hypothetical protein [Spirochaetota bacterium]